MTQFSQNLIVCAIYHMGHWNVITKNQIEEELTTKRIKTVSDLYFLYVWYIRRHLRHSIYSLIQELFFFLCFYTMILVIFIVNFILFSNICHPILTFWLQRKKIWYLTFPDMQLNRLVYILLPIGFPFLFWSHVPLKKINVVLLKKFQNQNFYIFKWIY